jgi:S1-C subfamily serine protease
MNNESQMMVRRFVKRVKASQESILRHYRIGCVWLLAIALVPASTIVAQDDLRTLRAKAIRQAANVVAPSMVRVEKFGVAEAGGEVADDAPTVAIAVDRERHFIASSLVRRQTPASIVLVASDGRRSAAKIVASDDRRQLVLLEAAEDLEIPPVEFSEPKPEVGETVIAVGRMAGDGSIAVSSGILSAKDRLWGIALQTDARVSSVFYGGPLVNLKGELLGVLVPAVPDDMGEDVTAWYDSGVAFAIPADAIKERLPTWVKGESNKAGLVGIVAKSNDPYVESTVIATVLPRSPAARADLQAGDSVYSIDGQLVRSHREIKQILGPKDAGQSVVIEVVRKGTKMLKQLTLTDTIPPLEPQWIGITANDLANVAQDETNDDAKNEDEQRADASSAGVLVTGVFDESPAAKLLQAGDVITKVNDADVSDVASLRRRVFTADPEQTLTVTIQRADENGQKTPSQITIRSTDVKAEMPGTLPASLLFADAAETKWTVTELTLPDLSNRAMLVATDKVGEQPADAAKLGLLIVLADPGEADLKKVANGWLDQAKKYGVIVCVMAPAKDDRWQPDELDAGSRIVSSLAKRYAIDPVMCAITGAGKGAGGSMAMAMAISRSGTFSGLAVHPEVKPPAIRLRENDPSAPLQLLLRGDSTTDEPSWSAVLEKTGYAVLRGDENAATLLNWVRSLPRI